MGSPLNILNNTILIPEHDSLVSSNPLPNFDVPKKLEELKKPLLSSQDSFNVNLKVNDGQSVRLIAVQQVTGFGMKRENEKKPGITGDYVVNLPGPITYSDISIYHLFTKDQFFLNWLTSGVLQGGAPRADMELHITPKTDKKMVFTIYDAFPNSWEIEQLDVKGQDKVLIERVNFTFSWISYKTVPVI